MKNKKNHEHTIKHGSALPDSRKLKAERYSRGVTILLVIAFMGVFALIMSSITGYVFQQSRYGRALYAREQSLHIAEAGLEYYRWFLAHNPSIMEAGAGLVSPYTYTVTDPEGGDIGESVVTATANLQCGVPQWIDVSAKGTAEVNPLFSRTLSARYMRPSVAEYSNITNANVWFGSTGVSSGPVHSNGGIRMDGANDSDVTSPLTTVYCDGSSASLGCNGVSPNPSAGWKDGVFGLGSGSALWRWGATVPNVSFPNMALNYDTLKGYAQTSGVYLPYTLSGTTVGGSDSRGYHLVFQADGTVNVYRVFTTVGVWSKHVTDTSTWVTDDHIIASGGEVFVSNYPVPSGCSLIYSEAKTWIEGTIAGKVTVVAADAGSFTPDIILANNTTYTTADGSVGLTAVAERSVLIPLNSPDSLTIRGIFVALTGYFGRNYYAASGSRAVPSAYTSNVTQSTLNKFGTVVSTLRPVTRWTSGGVFVSGYNAGTTSYDRVLAFSPPPFTPTVSTDYGFSLWREQ